MIRAFEDQGRISADVLNCLSQSQMSVDVLNRHSKIRVEFLVEVLNRHAAF